MPDKPLQIRGLIPSFQLQAANHDAVISPWHYKQNKHLVIVFFHQFQCAACRSLLLKLADHYQHYRASDAEVLALSSGCIQDLRQFAEHYSIPFPVLWDEENQVRCAYIGQPQTKQSVGVFVCDRFGELYMMATASEANQLPGEAEIREWLEFVDIQCPECFPPDWR
ncbi:MAG: hypothetical protein Kow00121_63100 [Elainellaceae cyanobacterium]